MEEYAKAIPSLSVVTVKANASEEDLARAFRQQLLLVAGFKKEDVERLNISSMSDEDFQTMLREKLIGVLVNNGSRQKVVPVSEVRGYISSGYEFEANLGNGEAVVRLSSS